MTDFESVSTSIHKPEEALKAQELGADFVFAGHVFATDMFWHPLKVQEVVMLS